MHFKMFVLTRACALVVALNACTTGSGSETLPEVAFYYPIDLTYHAGSNSLYVLNTNFDARYETGWVSQLDLDALVNAESLATLELSALYQDSLPVYAYGGELLLDANT